MLLVSVLITLPVVTPLGGTVVSPVDTFVVLAVSEEEVSLLAELEQAANKVKVIAMSSIFFMYFFCCFTSIILPLSCDYYFACQTKKRGYGQSYLSSYGAYSYEL